MKYNSLIAILLLLTIIIGCSKEMSADEKTATEFIAPKGYQVITEELEPMSYVLDKDKLKKMPYSMYWSVQEVNPEDYLGKEIVTIGYKVKNHPLEKIYNTSTLVYVMLSAGKPVGSYSLPNIEGSAGWVYSLDGKTLEEISRMTYAEWVDYWNKKWE